MTVSTRLMDRAETVCESGPHVMAPSNVLEEQGRNLEPLVLCSTLKGFRLAVPRRGHVLSTVVEIYGNPIREAVAILSASLERENCSPIREAFSPRPKWHGSGIVVSDAKMSAWAMASIWVVGVATKALPVTASLAESERWFFGSHAQQGLTSLPAQKAIVRAESALRTQVDASAYFELLPYIFDPHGPGSRLSVRRNPATRAARTRKRAEGVFYTPADVAEYMASACLDSASSDDLPIIFDPACGTGVFLRAALQEIRKRHPEKDAFSLAAECLFGSDIDPWPLDATAFVLLADSWIESRERCSSPSEAWHKLRLNLACVDTLLIDPAEGTLQIDCKSEKNRQLPFSGKGLFTQGDYKRFSFSQIFPTSKRRPTVVLGNPPYANLGRRPDLPALKCVLETIAVKPHSNAEIYPAFIEQMIRLADEEVCSGALVLPLSIACNVGPQFSVTRKIISSTRGRWRFSFFDREPHALFGEDVKTRNTILLWSRDRSDRSAVLSTGPLRKWHGDSRAAMFRALTFTRLDSDISDGIPKIEGKAQAAALRRISTRLSRLEQVVDVGRFSLAKTPDADDRTVFIGPTAYNFINVFLRPPDGVLGYGQVLSEHPLFSIKCASTIDALTVFAIFSSHLAYWWWHAHCDGFHVSRRFIAELPFGREAFSESATSILSPCGAELWSMIKKRPIISLNRGRTSLAYTPNGYDDIRRKIDKALANIAGIQEAFVDELQQFTARTVAATLRRHAITETED